MSTTLRGYDLNDVGEAPDWAPRERLLFETIISKLPDAGATLVTTEHEHRHNDLQDLNVGNYYHLSFLQYLNFLPLINNSLVTTHHHSELWDSGNVAARVAVNAAGQVGIGIQAPDSLLHVWAASAGAVAAPAGTLLTLESNDTSYLQFLSPNNKTQYIQFGDVDNSNAAFIGYMHASTAFYMQSETGYAMMIGAGVHIIDAMSTGITFNLSKADIDQTFNGDTDSVCTLDAGLDQWHYFDNKVLSFGATAATPDLKLYSDGTTGIAVGTIHLPDESKISFGTTTAAAPDFSMRSDGTNILMAGTDTAFPGTAGGAGAKRVYVTNLGVLMYG